MRLNPIAVIVLLCSLLSTGMGIYAYRRRSTVGALPFAFFMFSFAIYSLGYSLELSSQTLETVLLWNKFQYLGILAFPTIYLIFCIQYSGHDSWINRKRLIRLFVVPLVFMIIKIFDGSLHFIYESVALDNSSSILLLNFNHGPVYPLIVAYNMLVVTIGNVLLIEKRRFGSALYRKQSMIMLVAAGIIYLIYGVYLSGYVLFPELPYLDLNPFAYTLWGSAISLAIFKYRLFDLAPIARDALIELLQDGVIVMDSNLRIVDVNPEAAKIFGWVAPPVGRFAPVVMGNLFNYSILNDLDASTSIETTIQAAGKARYYELTISVLNDKTGLQIGNLIVLHDISDRKDAERRLEEMSLVDEMTGLSNRRGLKVLATQLMNMADRMQVNATLYYLDLDYLKQINDTYGHYVGDQAIIDAASVLKSSFRAADIIARVGGDEFVILVLESAENSRAVMLERLADSLRLHQPPDRKYQLSFSIGMASYEWNDPKSMDVLFQMADESMYESKRAAKMPVAV